MKSRAQGVLDEWTGKNLLEKDIDTLRCVLSDCFRAIEQDTAEREKQEKKMFSPLETDEHTIFVTCRDHRKRLDDLLAHCEREELMAVIKALTSIAKFAEDGLEVYNKCLEITNRNSK